MSKKPQIDKDLLQHLAELARLDLGSNEGGMLEDFSEIVEYFEKLEGLDVEDVEPMTGGTDLVNVWREDKYNEDNQLEPEPAVDAFPEVEEGGNKVPPVF